MVENKVRSGQVYDQLKDFILSQQIKPGERIPEAKLATQLGLSRTPIREAVKQLANDGIVTVYPNRFAEVAVLPENWLQEVGIVRLSLDITAAHLAILYGSNYDYSVLEQLNEECHAATISGDIATRIRKNCAFHLELSRMSRNAELYELQKKLYLKIEFVQACNYSNVETDEEQYRQHKEMIKALYERNEKQLVSVLTLHIEKFHNLKSDPAINENLQALFAAVPNLK